MYILVRNLLERIKLERNNSGRHSKIDFVVLHIILISFFIK